MKVCFMTFGCRLNTAEALQMEADYLARGWTLTDSRADADLFVVRGCSVTLRAERECEHLIEHLRRHYPTTPLRICGCVRNWTSPREAEVRQDARATTAVPTRTARAYLKVQDGCTGGCTFCIVPRFRGKSVSVPFDTLLDKAARFIRAGYHEIVVTGCNLALYESEGRRLPDLLAALADLTPVSDGDSFDPATCRIRLGSIEPGPCAMETVQVMAAHPNICRFLHLTVQSGSNDILQRMNRPYSVKDAEAVAAEAAKLLPGLGLGCDLMTGFPGETMLDYMSTDSILKRLPFTHAHIFPFSARPGTLAARMPHQLPQDVRTDRAKRLARAIDALRRKFAQTFVGKTVAVVSETEGRCEGWTSEYLPCKASVAVPRKSLVRIRVTSAIGSELEGELAD